MPKFLAADIIQAHNMFSSTVELCHPEFISLAFGFNTQ